MDDVLHASIDAEIECTAEFLKILTRARALGVLALRQGIAEMIPEEFLCGHSLLEDPPYQRVAALLMLEERGE